MVCRYRGQRVDGRVRAIRRTCAPLCLSASLGAAERRAVSLDRFLAEMDRASGFGRDLLSRPNPCVMRSDPYCPGQVPGSGSSIRLVAPCGRTWRAIVSAGALVLFLIMWMSLPPSSMNALPALYWVMLQ